MLLIKNGKIVPMKGERLQKGRILGENGKIKEIGVDISVAEGTVVIDANGKIVMPGFIDAHTHLGLKESAIQFEGMDHNEISDVLGITTSTSKSQYHRAKKKLVEIINGL